MIVSTWSGILLQSRYRFQLKWVWVKAHTKVENVTKVKKELLLLPLIKTTAKINQREAKTMEEVNTTSTRPLLMELK